MCTIITQVKKLRTLENCDEHGKASDGGIEIPRLASRPAKRDSKRLLSASAPLKRRATPSRPAGAGLELSMITLPPSFSIGD
jgi:hypothetical protein